MTIYSRALFYWWRFFSTYSILILIIFSSFLSIPAIILGCLLSFFEPLTESFGVPSTVPLLLLDFGSIYTSSTMLIFGSLLIVTLDSLLLSIKFCLTELVLDLWTRDPLLSFESSSESLLLFEDPNSSCICCCFFIIKRYLLAGSICLTSQFRFFVKNLWWILSSFFSVTQYMIWVINFGRPDPPAKWLLFGSIYPKNVSCGYSPFF